MDPIVRVVVSQILSVVSSEVISDIKKRVVRHEARALINVVENKLDDFADKISKLSQVSEFRVASRSSRSLESFNEHKKEPEVMTEDMKSVALESVKAVAEFLIRYPEAKAGRQSFKDIVCDMSAVISEVMPKMEGLGVPKEVGTIGFYVLSQMTGFVSEGKSEEAANMLYEMISSLVVSESRYSEAV